MSVSAATAPSPPPSPRGRGSDLMGRRWLALAFIALAQLMVALDATIVNIALPTAQSSLQFSDAQRQWVITSYTLAFGGLLLLGGRVADAVGRKRALLFGLAGFAAASAVSGAAVNLPMLLAARALQGAFAAILAPTALSLLAVTFTEPKDRARAAASAVAHPVAPQPLWCIPVRRAGDRRHMRAVPLPPILPAVRRAVLTTPGRSGRSAAAGRGHAGLVSTRQPAAAATAAARTDG